jgi:predicted nuclease of predicted toxin-antitoxin system
MIIFADECVYQTTVDHVRSWGFNLTTVQEAGFAGEKNGKLITYAQENKMIFLTRDKDFTDIHIYPPHTYYGIIVLKITPINQSKVHQTLHRLLNENDLNKLVAKLIIVATNKYRIFSENNIEKSNNTNDTK